MLIIPAIDLIDGKVKRLTRGDFAQQEEYNVDPVEKAKEFAKAGAKWIHVVDLYGALKGHFKLENLSVLKKIVQKVHRYDTSVQFGGGVRSKEDIECILKTKASRVILGTLPQESLSSLRNILKDYGDKIAISLDAKKSILYKQGWTESSTVEIKTFLQYLENCGVKLVIYTNISKDGMLQGPDFEGIKNILSLTKIPVIASGGISSLEDIKELKKLGVYGIIIGKALYKGKIDLKEALKLC
jgi:phosphoribosylformimino-5-aminoimidazole carboxamide ribotide isomerase